MDSEVLTALLGVFGTVIVGLLGLCGILVRRNGKSEPHNPNLGIIDEKMTDVLVALAGMKEAIDNMKGVVGSCGDVQRMRGEK